MKSLIASLLTATACLVSASGAFAQIVPAVSLGDPIPSYQSDPNIVTVSGSSCGGCAAKISFQPCQGATNGCGCKETVVSVPCPGGCSKAPSCSIAAKCTPCKACDVPKIVHRIPACSTCAPAPKAVACKTCSTPAPCATCTAKPACAVVKSAPCSTPCAKTAAATCSTCDPCKAHAHKASNSRPILDALAKLFTRSGHHTASTCDSCSSCSSATTKTVSQSVTTQDAAPVSHQTSYRSTDGTPMPVNAAIAPYAPQATYTTALPPAEVNVPSR